MGDFEKLWENRLSDMQIEAIVTSILPSWAIAFAHGELVMGAQLATRDGRKCGNGHIVDINESEFGESFIVLTDAGNLMVLSFEEVGELFYYPKYISNIDEVMERFGRWE